MCKTMETHTSILGLLKQGPTRRRLFGPVDREQLRADCQAALRRDLEEASRRWSYDFIADRPLERGDFLWEGIPSAKVPLPYSLPASDQEEEHGASGGAAGQTAECSTAMEKAPEKDDHVKLKRKQTNITDFYQAKKRVVKTPRKSGQ